MDSFFAGFEVKQHPYCSLGYGRETAQVHSCEGRYHSSLFERVHLGYVVTQI